jgi:hypothetical protein
MCDHTHRGAPLADLAFAGLDRKQEEELMTCFRNAAILAAIITGATTASAQTTIITREPVESTVVITEPLELTPVQRRTSYRTIMRERAVSAEPTVEYRVGARTGQGAALFSPARSSSRSADDPIVQIYGGK